MPLLGAKGDSGGEGPGALEGRRTAVAVLGAAVVLCAAAGWYAASSLELNTDTAELLSDRLPFRRAMARYRRLFPHNERELVAVVEARTPERASRAAGELARRLRDRPGAVEHVYRPREGPFFARHALLYQDLDALERITGRVAQMQPMLAALKRDPSLAGFCHVLRQAATRDSNPGQRLRRMYPRIRRAVTAQLDGRAGGAISWQRLMRGGAAASGPARSVIVVAPRLDYGRLLPASGAIDAIHAAAAAAGLDERSGTRVLVTGKVALSHQEMRTLLTGMAFTGPLALAAVGIVLLVGLRSLRLTVATGVTLLAGLVLTAGFAALAVGRLNMISLAFALLYLGLGVDFAVHFALRYRARRRGGDSVGAALAAARRRMAWPLGLCALTTGIGFVAFVPTAFAGVAELGVIAGGGMVIAWITTMSVFPAVVALLPGGADGGGTEGQSRGGSRAWLRFPVRRRKAVLGVVTLALVVAGALATRITFQSDPVALRRADGEAVRGMRVLRAGEAPAGEGGFALADNREAAASLAADLRGRPEVARAVTIESLIPERQKQKLERIEELALLMGVGWRVDAEEMTIEPIEAQAEAVRRLRRALRERDGPEARRLGRTLDRWLARYESQSPRERRAWVRGLHRRMLGSLPPALARFAEGLRAQRITRESLPAALRSRWVADDGTHRVRLAAAGDLGRESTRRRFVEAIASQSVTVGGPVVVQVKAAAAVAEAFRSALFYAVCGIFLVLLIQLRRLSLALLVMIPLIAGGLLTVGAMGAFGIPFHFANVIALPLLFGVGVDNGIHMVHRSRWGDLAPDGLLGTATARAIVISGLTTLCGFGALAISPHPGTASMGRVLVLGLALIVGCTLFVLPALLPGPLSGRPGNAE